MALRKTARAAQEAGERGQRGTQKKEELTAENAIKEIRNLRTAKLFVGNMEYVDKLLEAYDEVVLAASAPFTETPSESVASV